MNKEEIVIDNGHLIHYLNDHEFYEYDTLYIGTLDYITNLQQENQQLKERIDKAIEYLEQPPVILINGEYRNIYAEDDNKLLEILKGDSNEPTQSN